MSHRFLELGANVVICGRREDVLEQTAEELTKETGAEIETIRCDVRLDRRAVGGDPAEEEVSIVTFGRF
jgi:short-subunit dehydrogenase